MFYVSMLFRYAPFVLLGLTALFVISTFTGESGLVELRNLDAALETQRKINGELRETVQSLRYRIVALERSDLALEEEARARLRMMKPGEIVVYFDDEAEEEIIGKSEAGI